MATRAVLLLSLAEKINANHAKAISAARACLEHARQAGELLIEARAGCQPGKWADWLLANRIQFSLRTAARYMRLAREWATLFEVVGPDMAHLSIEKALALLARHDPRDDVDAPRPKVPPGVAPTAEPPCPRKAAVSPLESWEEALPADERPQPIHSPALLGAMEAVRALRGADLVAFRRWFNAGMPEDQP